MRCIVIGAGRQGPAAAFDLAKFGSFSQIVLADADLDAASAACSKVNFLLGHGAVTCGTADASDRESLRGLLAGFDLAIAAAPYRLNPNISHAGIDVGCHVVDMGLDAPDALEVHARTEEAAQKGVCILTDCGIAPGTVNVMAMALLASAPRATRVRLYCGGLPETAGAPFFHKVMFSVESLLGEYVDEVDSLRNGEIVWSQPLEGFETIEFEGFGKLEAVTTSGGTGTAPYHLKGRLRDYEYKTLRHPGHWQAMKTLRDGGFWSEQPVEGCVPRDLTLALMALHMVDPESKDVVVTRVVVEGDNGDATMDLVDWSDPLTGFTAMQRTTGFSTAIAAHEVANGRVKPGCWACEQAVDAGRFLKALANRGINVKDY